MFGKLLALVGLAAMSGVISARAVEAGVAKPDEAPKAMSAAPAAAPAPSDANAPGEKLVPPTDTNAVIVTVNGKSLTVGMINWLQPNAEPFVIKSIADFWVTTQLLNAEAVKRNIPDSPKAQFLGQLNTMQTYGREVMQQVQESTTVSEADIDDYCNKNKDTEHRSRDQIKKDLEYKARAKAVQEFIKSLKEKSASEIHKSEFLLQAEKLAPSMGQPDMGGHGLPGVASRKMPPPVARPVPPPPPVPAK